MDKNNNYYRLDFFFKNIVGYLCAFVALFMVSTSIKAALSQPSPTEYQYPTVEQILSDYQGKDTFDTMTRQYAVIAKLDSPLLIKHGQDDLSRAYSMAKSQLRDSYLKTIKNPADIKKARAEWNERTKELYEDSNFTKEVYERYFPGHYKGTTTLAFSLLITLIGAAILPVLILYFSIRTIRRANGIYTADKARHLGSEIVSEGDRKIVRYRQSAFGKGIAIWWGLVSLFTITPVIWILVSRISGYLLYISVGLPEVSNRGIAIMELISFLIIAAGVGSIFWLRYNKQRDQQREIVITPDELIVDGNHHPRNLISEVYARSAYSNTPVASLNTGQSVVVGGTGIAGAAAATGAAIGQAAQATGIAFRAFYDQYSHRVHIKVGEQDHMIAKKLTPARAEMLMKAVADALNE